MNDSEPELSAEKIKEMIKNGKESETLDFKKDFNDDPADVLMDIICFANSPALEDAHIIYGVEEDDHHNYKIVGLDESRLPTHGNLEHFKDILKDEMFFYGSAPKLDYSKVSIDGKTIGILTIKPAEDGVPYILTEDKFFKNKNQKDRGERSPSKSRRIMAYRIYSRNSSHNTPWNKSASPDVVDKLYKARFGLLNHGVKAFLRAMQDHENWNFIESNNDNHYLKINCISRPVLSIRQISDWESEEVAPQSALFPDKRVKYCKIEYVENENLVSNGELYEFDQYRTIVPVPNIENIEQILNKKSSSGYVVYYDYYNLDELNGRLFELLRSLDKTSSRLGNNPGVFLTFRDKSEKEEFNEFLAENSDLFDETIELEKHKRDFDEYEHEVEAPINNPFVFLIRELYVEWKSKNKAEQNNQSV